MRCLEDVLNFLIAKGLSDKNGDVSTAALNAGREVMQQYGEEGLGVLLPILEVVFNCLRVVVYSVYGSCLCSGLCSISFDWARVHHWHLRMMCARINNTKA